MVAAVAHDADLGLRHEGHLDAELACHLHADLAIGDEVIRGAVRAVVHEVELELPGVLVIAFDHVEAHRLGVADHPLVDLPRQLERPGVVRRADTGAGDRVVALAAPGDLRLGAAAQLVACPLFETVDRPAHHTPDVGRQGRARVAVAVVAAVEAAEEAADVRRPGQHLERVGVGYHGKLFRRDATAEQLAVSIDGDVGDRGAVELHAPVEAASKVRGRDDLGQHATVDRDELVVDELHTGLGHPRGEGVGGRGVGLPVAG